MPAQIILTSVVFAGNVMLKTPMTGVIIRHRLTSDPDVPASYITDSTDAVINTDGTFLGTVVIDGLLYNTSYTILVIDACGCGKQLVIITKPPACVDVVGVVGTVTETVVAGIATFSVDSQGQQFALQQFTCVAPATKVENITGDIITSIVVSAGGAPVVNVSFQLQSSNNYISPDFSRNYTTPAGFIVDSTTFDFDSGFFTVVGHYPGTALFNFIFILNP